MPLRSLPHPTVATPVAALVAGSLVLALLAGCGPQAQGQGQGPGGGGQVPPPPPVGVVKVAPGSVALGIELPGRLEPIRTAQVRARVTGVVRKRLFNEGAMVKAGQSLYEIDAAPYQAALQSARATLAKAEANLAQAQATLERNRPLAEARAISQQEWVATQAAQQAAAADVAAGKAAVDQARLNVEYAAVIAPIPGRIGRSLVTEGALVSASEATLLATIQQVDTLMVNFTQSAAEVLRLQRSIASGRLQGSGSAQVQVVLEDGTVHPQAGRLLFSDIAVDPATGQVTLRAEVPNPRGELLPGLFVRVRLAQARSKDAILLPQQAVTRGTAGDTVMVVGEGNQVSVRPVTLGGAHSDANGPQWVVTAGLKEGEQVVVDGFQKIRPKAPVTPVPWSPAGAASAPNAPGAPASAAPAPRAGASR